VHGIVAQHGGALNVQSRLGEGSTFTVSIPAGWAHLPAERLRASREAASTAVRAGAFVDEALSWLPGTREEAREAQADARRVLLADDNADLREYVRRLLAEHYKVEPVSDGETALAAARARRPDLVVTDIMMPGLGGFGLIRALRGDPALSEVPVIALSARAGEEARIEGLERGADDYLTKPFSARELLVRCEALLRSQEVRTRARHAVQEREEKLAAEAAALARPSIVGMQGFEELRRYTDPEVIPPALVCRADDVESAIERLVADTGYRLELGRRARRFLEERWSPKAVAARFVRLASGDIPGEWWFDPHTISYLNGWGLTETRVREVVRTILDERGPSALALADKPALRHALIEFARTGVRRSDAAVAAP
jgi:CheY-like chemotaxis protein